MNAALEIGNHHEPLCASWSTFKPRFDLRPPGLFAGTEIKRDQVAIARRHHHAVAGGVHHHLAAEGRQGQQLVLGDHPGDTQRHELAVAVPGHGVGGEPRLAQDPHRRELHGAERRLGHPRVGECGPLGLPFGRAERVAGEQLRRERLVAREHSPHGRHRHEQLGQHVGALRSLAREQPRHLRGGGVGCRAQDRRVVDAGADLVEQHAQLGHLSLIHI